MNNQTRQEIAAEIAEFTRRPKLKEDEITVRQYADLQDVEYKTAYDALMTVYKAGIMERRKVLHGNRWCWAFRKVNSS